MKKLLILLIITILAFNGISQDLSTYHPIAKYPFALNLADATGNFGDATAMNTTFDQGAIYCTGVYPGGNPNGCYVKTPEITSLDYAKFAITFDFKTDTSATVILVCGEPWRWLIIDTKSDSTVELFASLVGGGYQVLSSTMQAVPGTWYSMGIIYDSTSRVLSCYINNSIIVSDTLTAQFEFKDKKNFGSSDGGVGRAFKGWWKQLTFYTPNPVGLTDVSVSHAQIYPNPVNNIASVRFNAQENEPITIRLFDIYGRQLQMIEEKGSSGTQELQIQMAHYPAGTYLLKIEQNGLFQLLQIQKQ